MTYNVKFGNGMFIGCAFTLVMTLGTFPLLSGEYGDNLTGPIIVTVGYVILAMVLASLGVMFRRGVAEKPNEVIGIAVRYIGIAFVIVGLFGVAANVIEGGIGYGLPNFVLFAIIGIVSAVLSARLITGEGLETSRKAVMALFLISLMVALVGICGAMNDKIGFSMFNILMISIVMAVYFYKLPAGPSAE